MCLCTGPETCWRHITPKGIEPVSKDILTHTLPHEVIAPGLPFSPIVLVELGLLKVVSEVRAGPSFMALALDHAELFSSLPVQERPVRKLPSQTQS